MDQHLTDEIDRLVRRTKGHQMTREEYTEIAEKLGGKNLLVFGTGYDSDLWRKANGGGRTVFLENLDEWIPEGSTDVIKVAYTTKITDHAELLEKEDALTMGCLPDDILGGVWDVIFVDSPTGYTSDCPGRMQSIFTAMKVANEDTLIYVHDCDRIVEDTYTKHFLEIETQFRKLRRCRLKSKPPAND